MKLHSNIITRADLQDALNVTGLSRRGVYLDSERRVSEHRSRKRARSFRLYLVATDGYGRRWTNSGNHGAGTDKAATWLEWGAFLAELFHRDPEAVTDYYDGAENFIESTRRGPGNVKPDEIPATVEQWRNLYVKEMASA